MTRVALIVMACVRWWTRLYTWRLPPALRDARRAEIESDLWESAHDPDFTQAEFVMHTMMRLTMGIADDLAWRFANLRVRHVALRSVTAAGVLCMLLLFATLSRLTTDVHLPEPAIAPAKSHRRVPDPPPPPPPPDARSGEQSDFRYGRTSYSVVTDGRPRVLLTHVQPIYPPVAESAGIEGQVLVKGKIAEDGRVIDAEVAPNGILGQSALDAIQRWEFAAARDEAGRLALLTVRVSFARSP